MKKALNQYAWIRIVLGILVVALGVVLIIVSATNNDATKITKVICIIFGAYITLLSAVALIVGLAVEAKNRLVVPAAAIALVLSLGLVFIIFSNDYAAVLETIVRTLVPMIILVIGATLVIQSIIEIVAKMDSKAWIAKLVLGVLLVTLGIILLATGNTVTVIYVILGVLLVVLGILWLVFGIIYAKNKRKAFKEADANANK